MRDDGVIKRRKLHETATENSTYIYQNPQEKQSLHQISYQGHGCLVGNMYMSIQIHLCRGIELVFNSLHDHFFSTRPITRMKSFSLFFVLFCAPIIGTLVQQPSMPHKDELAGARNPAHPANKPVSALLYHTDLKAAEAQSWLPAWS